MKYLLPETAMGVKLTKANQLDEYRELIHRIGRIHTKRFVTPWMFSEGMFNLFGDGRKEKRLTDEVHKFTGSIIATHRAAKENTSTDQSDNSISDDENENSPFRKRRYAMLDTLLQAEKRNEIDGAGIQEEVDTFVFEGYDTTMTAITFTLLMIAEHSDVQRRVFEEIKTISGEN